MYLCKSKTFLIFCRGCFHRSLFFHFAYFFLALFVLWVLHVQKPAKAHQIHTFAKNIVFFRFRLLLSSVINSSEKKYRETSKKIDPTKKKTTKFTHKHKHSAEAMKKSPTKNENELQI